MKHEFDLLCKISHSFQAPHGCCNAARPRLALSHITNILITHKEALSGTTAVTTNICCGTRKNTTDVIKSSLSLFHCCFLLEHQAALLQLKRECKEELEKLQVSMKDNGERFNPGCCHALRNANNFIHAYLLSR